MNEYEDSCRIMELPQDELVAAAERACQINPLNRPSPGKLMRAIRQVLDTVLPVGEAVAQRVEEEIQQPQRLAVLTRKMWSRDGVKLKVGFIGDPPQAVKTKIVSLANDWRKHANVEFVLSDNDPEIRIAAANDGYWSYLGTDILGIPKNRPTMNLQGWATDGRVVWHEFGHTLGFPHEHMRKQLVELLDEAKTILYFQRTQGWSAAVTRQQVLTPLNEASIRGTLTADQDSIMCYQLPGSITKNGQPIRGGAAIDALDAQFIGTIYPKEVSPPVEPPVEPPPQPPTGGWSMFVKIWRSIAALKAFVTDHDFIKLVLALKQIWGITMSMEDAKRLAAAPAAEAAEAAVPSREETKAWLDGLKEEKSGK